MLLPTYYRVHSLTDYTVGQAIKQTMSPGQKQPDSSLLKNCTAVTVDWKARVRKIFIALGWKSKQRYTSWMAVPCSERFNATYVCQTHRKISYKSNVTSIASRSSYDCNTGWFMFDGSPKCYTFLRAPPNLSYHVANTYCSAMNSSVLQIDTTRYAENLNLRGKARLSDFRNELYYGKGIFLPRSLIVEGIGSLLNMWVGRALKKQKQEQVLNIFKILMLPKFSDGIFIPVSLHKSCGFIAYSIHLEKFMRNDGLYIMKGWSAKFTKCDEIFAVDAFICEKTSHLTEKMCISKHHKCDDGTCILAIYMCDTVHDCFDGTDEYSCNSQIISYNDTLTFILLDSSLYLPCPIYSTCDLASNISLSPLYIHEICDGFPSKDIFLHEGKVCLQRNMRKFDMADLFHSQFSIPEEQDDPPWEDMNLQVFQNFRLKNEAHYHTLNDKETVPQSSIKYYQTKCKAVGQVTTMSDICKVELGNQCDSMNIDQVCRDIYCPGMFKCTEYFCIFLSSVCDGHIDCPYRDDELSCSNPICPGSLKCRGEIRCISPEQICDGTVDCIYSFDDEVYCEKCPVDCTCVGYLLKCNLQNSLENLSNIAKLYSKGVVLKGNQENISLDILFTLSLVYIDISHCNTRHIKTSSKSYSGYQYILFGDLSKNNLYDTSFLSVKALSKIVVIDLSYNLISVIVLKNVRLPYLVILDLSNNPLIAITFPIITKLESLRSINIQYVTYNLKMFTNPIDQENIEIKVTDERLCCLLPKRIKCIHLYNLKERCYGIMPNVSSGIVFSCLTFIAIILLIIVTISSIKNIRSSNNKKHYNTAKMNHIIADIISTSALACLAIIGWTQIHLITWRQSISCIFINAMFSVSLGTTAMFKTFSLLYVSLKIMYPFGHKLAWLNRTALLSSGIWFTNLLLFGVSAAVANFQNKYLLLDNLCSLGECHLIRMTGRLMLVFVCLLQLIAIIGFIVIIYKMTITLIKNSKCNVIKQKVPVTKIVLVFSRQMVGQCFLALSLLVIIIFKFVIHALHVNYCLGMWTYILPICLSISSVMNMLM